MVRAAAAAAAAHLPCRAQTDADALLHAAAPQQQALDVQGASLSSDVKQLQQAAHGYEKRVSCSLVMLPAKDLCICACKLCTPDMAHVKAVYRLNDLHTEHAAQDACRHTCKLCESNTGMTLALNMLPRTYADILASCLILT